MKIKVAGIFCVLVLVGAWVYVKAQTAPQVVAKVGLPLGTNGRYQIVAAEIATGDKWGDKEIKSKTVVRIDTQTGQAWRLVESEDVTPNGGEGQTHLSWSEVRDFNSASTH
jgi:hypothetical protein